MRAARMVVDCLRYSDAESWTRTLAFVVMPDHVHWCIELGAQKTLPQIMYSVKRFSSSRILAVTAKNSQLWQAGYHDRAIRAEEDVVEVSRYIVANPLRAGLVDEIGDYSHWDAVWLAKSGL